MKISTQGSSLRISDIPALNASTAPGLRDDARANVKSEHTSIDIDMSSTRFLDSSGLGALIALQKTMAQRSGALRIVNPSATVQQILELTRLHRVLEIVHE
jgi:anti-sigma B factor antagonist